MSRPALDDGRASASRADRWARLGAWCAVVAMVLALLWTGLALLKPLPAAAATPEAEAAPDSNLPSAVADTVSARSTP